MQNSYQTKYNDDEQTDILKPFYNDPQNQTSTINMITNPILLSSFIKQSQFYKQNSRIHIKAQESDPILQIESRLKVLNLKLKNQPKLNLEMENMQLKKKLKEKNEQISNLKLQMNKSIIQSKNAKYIFALRDQFYQKKLQYQSRMQSYSHELTKHIQKLNKKITNLQNQLQLKNIDHNRHHPHFQISNSIKPLVFDQDILSQNTEQSLVSNDQIHKKRTKIFIKKHQEQEYYKLIDQNGDFIQKNQVKQLLKNIEQFSVRLNLLITKLDEFGRVKMMCREDEEMVVESKKSIEYGSSFLSLLRKIEVVKVDLVNLESKTNLLNQNISKNINIQNFSHFK